MINFRAITEENFYDVIKMKRPENEHFVASNEKSLAQAWLDRNDSTVHPFAIYNDDELVGFMMLEEEPDERILFLWRIMFPVEQQYKGYGSQAIKLIIDLAKQSGKFDSIKLDYVVGNETAKHVYTKLGFVPTGEISNGEVVMSMSLTE